MRLHEIEVIQDLSNDLPKINAEPYQLEQVWINFISNARDVLDEKQKKITDGDLQEEDYGKKLIILTSYDPQERTIEVSFTDNGLGISEEVQTKICEPFFTTKKASKAMGLGLSTSYDIIKNHKGTIEVESEEGKGTMITATLPLGVNHGKDLNN